MRRGRIFVALAILAGLAACGDVNTGPQPVPPDTVPRDSSGQSSTSMNLEQHPPVLFRLA